MYHNDALILPAKPAGGALTFPSSDLTGFILRRVHRDPYVDRDASRKRRCGNLSGLFKVHLCMPLRFVRPLAGMLREGRCRCGPRQPDYNSLALGRYDREFSEHLWMTSLRQSQGWPPEAIIIKAK